MKLAPLFDLLRELDGRDVDKMAEADGKKFCEAMLEKFRVVAAPIPGIVLGSHITDGYVWHVEGNQFFPGDYVGSAKIVHTGKMEAAIGEPERLRMAAALFPVAAFEVALFCDFHRDGGLQSKPRLKLSIGTDGRDGLRDMSTALGMVAEALADALVQPGVVGFQIVATENACDDIENPKDVRKAFEAVASAAKKAAREGSYGYGDDLVTERVELTVDVAAVRGEAAASAERLLKLLGAVFVAISAR